MRRFYFAIVLLLALFSLGSGRYESGSVNNGEDWVLVSQFSFVDDIGQLDYKVEYPGTDECCPSLAYYFHESYESASNGDMGCQSKLAYAEGVVTFQNMAHDNSTNGNISTHCLTSNTTNLRQCSGTLRLQSTHDHWWFFVLSHCNSSKGLDISYEFTFTNGKSWEKHLSAEELHILETQAISFGGILFIFIAGLYISRQLLRRDKLHRAYKLFMMSLSYETLAQLLDYIYYSHYVRSGLQLHSLQTIAQVSHATSEVTLVILLILLAYGWTITTARFIHKTQMKLTVFLSLYTLTYGILYIFKQEFLDPEASHFLFESVVDKGYRALKIIAWVCFAYGAKLSIASYPVKKKFFLYFMLFFSVWFLFVPLVVLAFSFLFNEFLQLTAMRILRLIPFLCFVGYGGLLVVMRPSQVDVNFPFHVPGNGVLPEQVQDIFNSQHTENFANLGNDATGPLKTDATNSDDRNRF